MRYVLDTNIVSAAMEADPLVFERLRGLRYIDVGIPQPVLAELAAGLAQMPKSKRKRALKKTLEELKRDLPRSSWSDEVSERFGEVKGALLTAGRPLEDFDIAIAAHALAEGATLVTANTRHFERIAGLTLENWLETH